MDIKKLGPIRVIRIISRMNIGGPAIQIFGLMQNLPTDKFQQFLITGFCDDNEIEFIGNGDFPFPAIRVVGFGRNIRGISEIKTFFEIRKIIKHFKPHIVHTHTTKAGVLGRLASLSILQKHIRIHTYHGHLLHGYFGALRTQILIVTERFLARFTHQLVSVGQIVRKEILAAGIGSLHKFSSIAPGVLLKPLPARELAQLELGIQSHNFTIGWVGRLVPIKAPHRICEIARACVERGLNVQFLVIGDGPLGSGLKEIVLNEELPITFLGWVRNIETVLAVTDLMLLTSLNEGMPLSLIESQMAGIPVISSNVGSVSEIVSHKKTGFCLDYSSREFATLIEQMLNDKNTYKEMSNEAKFYATRNFSVRRLVDDYADIYTKILSQSKI